MAHTTGALKRARQSVKRNAQNNVRRSKARTYMKQVRTAVEKKDTKTAAAALQNAIQALDKAARHRAVHPNFAARHKARLSRLVNALK